MKYNAFIDGSYKKVPGVGEVYSAAYILAPEGSSEWITCYKACDDAYVCHHNVAGEILAAMMVCEKAMSQGDCTELVIYHDYEGVANWVTGVWKRTNTELSKAYKQYMLTHVTPKLKITFVYTPSHTGIEGNELVDKLAKEAIDNYTMRKLKENRNG